MNAHETPQPPVLWIIWFALLSGMVVILMFAGGGWPSGEGDPVSFAEPMFLIPLGLFFVSFVIRWGVLSRMEAVAKQIPMAIIGMAMAESCMILGIFTLPEAAVLSKQILIVLAFLGVASFAPVYLVKEKRI